MTNNSLSEDIYAVGQLMADNLNEKGIISADVNDGLTTLAGKIRNIVAAVPTLSINVPLNLIYSDNFNITGTLLDANGNSISGASVKLKVGNTVVDTQTTNSNGLVSFTRSPVSMGTHSFQLVFDGDSSNAGAVSSVVTREINKETSVIAVSSPSSAGTYYTDGSISVAGNLKTDDDEVISGASVLVKLGSTILTTLTTDSNGSFTGSISVSLLSTGSNTLKFLFESNTYYATSYQDVIITVDDVSLTLESDKSILSYADEQQTPGSQVATLTATYNGTNVTGKNVTMKVYKESDDSLIETLQVTDNNDGTYTASYTSGGVGDIYIKAECSLVSETFAIVDALKYYPNETSSGIEINLDLPSEFEIDYKWTRKSNSSSTGILVATNGSRNAYVGQWSSSGQYGVFFLSPNNPITLASSSINSEVHLNLKYENGTYTLSDGTNTTTVTDFQFTKITQIGANGNCPLKEILIKPL